MMPNTIVIGSPSPPSINTDRRSTSRTEDTAQPSADRSVRTRAIDASAVPAASATPQATAEPDSQSLAAAVDTINTSLKSLQQTNLQFSMDDESGKMVVKVMDAEKDEVIRQIPPEEVLALAAFFKEAETKKSQRIELTTPGVRNSAAGSGVSEGLLLHTKA